MKNQTEPKAIVECDVIYDKLALLGTVAGLMAEHPEDFGKSEKYAMQAFLYEIAEEIFPEAKGRRTVGFSEADLEELAAAVDRETGKNSGASAGNP